MKASDRQIGTEEGRERDEFVRRVAERDGGSFERRHEALMKWAESEAGLERGAAEKVYALAEEEDLEPALALELVRAGLGVRELEPPDDSAEEDAMQQAPPDWIADEDAVEPEDVELERTLRASFRRLRSHLETSDTPSAAVEQYLADADVGRVRMR